MFAELKARQQAQAEAWKSPASMLAAAIFFILDFVGLIIFVGWSVQKKYHEMRSQSRDSACALYSTDPEKF